MKSLFSFFLFSIFALNIFSIIPVAAQATEGCPTDFEGYCIELQEEIAGQKTIKGKSGIDLISNYIGLAYKYGASIIGIICVLIIVVSGIQITMGSVNSEMVNQGKEHILQALLSLILLFSSALILNTINPGFFV